MILFYSWKNVDSITSGKNTTRNIKKNVLVLMNEVGIVLV